MKIGSIESLELLFSDCISNCFFATTQSSPTFALYQENSPPDNLILLNLPEECLTYDNDEAIIQKSDLCEQMQKRQITHFLLNSHSSENIERWAQQNEIFLLSTPWAMQRKMEDKIFFDQFLEAHRLPKPRSWILQSEKDIDKVSGTKLIVQRPWSWGAKGTFFARDNTILRKILVRENRHVPLLCREYIDGLTFGVTLMIGAKNVIFSALRLQASFLMEDGANKYFGIQWIKPDLFSKKLIIQLNAVLRKLSKQLQSIGFRGAANIDFIVRENQIYILECNPRLSGSTAQLTLEKSLFHGYDLMQEFISALTNRDLSANITEIPESQYEGASLELDLDNVLSGKTTTLANKKVGVYQYQGHQIDYLTSQLKTFTDNPSNVLLYHSVSQKYTANLSKFLGILMSHFPLFEVQDNRYNFSQQGKAILSIFQQATHAKPSNF